VSEILDSIFRQEELPILAILKELFIAEISARGYGLRTENRPEQTSLPIDQPTGDQPRRSFPSDFHYAGSQTSAGFGLPRSA
jgi:hypothetical protein